MTTKPATQRHLRIVIAATAVIAAVAWVFLFTPEGDHGIAWGMLGGFAAGLVAVALASWRSKHHGGDVTVAERIAAGVADERDQAIKQQAWAFTGRASLVYAGATSIALMLGTPAGLVSALLMWGGARDLLHRADRLRAPHLTARYPRRGLSG